MPTKQHDVPVICEKDGETSGSHLVMELWTKRRAARLGVRWCFAAWAGALVTLPIPIVHFVAVPGFLLIGPPLGYIIYRFYRGSVELISGELHCPGCRHVWQVEKQTVDFPHITRCPACSGEISVSQSSKA